MQKTRIRSFLSENGIRPMNKRVEIMNYLVSKHNHPTADMIYLELVSEIVGLSKTTVYNTLNLFVEGRIARALHIDSNELRYDANISQHGHFKCNKCAEVYDIPLNEKIFQDLRLKNFLPDDYQFSIKGICSICNKQMSAQSDQLSTNNESCNEMLERSEAG